LDNKASCSKILYRRKKNFINGADAGVEGPEAVRGGVKATA